MAELKRLYRIPAEHRIAGVCTGLGHYLAVDPVFVRLIWVVITIFSGVLPGILAYLLAWLVVPEQPRDAPLSENERRAPAAATPYQKPS